MASLRLPHGSMLIGVGFVTLAAAFSIRVVFALAMPLIGSDTGWSPVLLSGAMSLALIVSGILTPVAGRMLDRLGPRVVLMIGLALIGAGMGVLAAATTPWVLAASFGLLAGTGFALVSTAVVSTAVAVVFDQHRGLATGIATSGESAGQFLLTPLFAVLLAATGWRVTFLAAAGLAFAILAIVLFAMRTGRGTAARVTSERPVDASIWSDLRFLAAQPVFYLLFISYFVCGLTSTGFVESQFMPYVTFCGFPPLPTATAFGVLSLFNMFGMLISGWLTDRVNRVLLLASIFFVRGLSFVLLLNVGADYQTIGAFAVVFGLVDYSTVPVTVSLCASHLGVRRLGLAFGLISGGHAVAAAVGAILGGLFFALTGGYSLMWLVGVWTSLGAAALVLGLTLSRPAPATA